MVISVVILNIQACYYVIHSFSPIQSTTSQTISLIQILNILQAVYIPIFKAPTGNKYTVFQLEFATI
jgi:hypothetical protein